MKHEILPTGSLKISIDGDEAIELLKLLVEKGPEHFQSDTALREFLEPLICNSELEWADPVEVGALTDAPILAIFGNESRLGEGCEAGFGNRLCGRDHKGITVQNAEKYWGFMAYETINPLNHLLDHGFICFQLAA